MDRVILKNAIKSHCQTIKSRSIGDREIELICELEPSERKQLKNASGNAEKEILYADSSTALGVNYFSLYKRCYANCQVYYEWREASPLKIGGKSNIDIKVTEDDIVRYYESKFLEPYYMTNSAFTASYYELDKYKEGNADEIIKQIKAINKRGFKYYNISQLVRHLLAIVNHIKEKSNDYKGIKEVHLISICWEMPECFIADLKLNEKVSDRSISYLKKRIKILEEESKDVKKYIDQLINILQSNINVKLCFNTETYNKAIDKISNAENIATFKEQYYL
ncbi:MAG: hypothetical protein IKR71_01060 [Bacteroidales bacterium]|nr:hypothetical protein [Bacteroidales bacterium]